MDCSSPKSGCSGKELRLSQQIEQKGQGKRQSGSLQSLLDFMGKGLLLPLSINKWRLSSFKSTSEPQESAGCSWGSCTIRSTAIRGRQELRWFRQCILTFSGNAWVVQLSAFNRPRMLPAMMSAQLAAGPGVQAVTHRREHHSLKAGEGKRAYARV